MNVLLRGLLELARSEDGPTATEYGVLIALICLGVIGALSAFGDHVGNLWAMISGTMPGAGGP